MEFTASYRFALIGGATAIVSLHVGGSDGEELIRRLEGKEGAAVGVTMWPLDGQGPCLAGPTELFKVDREADGVTLALDLGGNRGRDRTEERIQLLGTAAAMAGLQVGGAGIRRRGER
jgi:hypothetical protein